MSEKNDKKAKVISILKAVKPRDKAVLTPSQSIVGNSNIQAGRDVNINKRVVTRPEVKPGPEHITEEQAFELSELVKQAVERDTVSGKKDTGKAFAAWWNKLKKRFKVASYRMIPREQGDEAIGWMKQQVAILRPKLRRTDNDAWRKTRYATIYACLKSLGKDKQWFYDLVYEKFGKKISSTTELGEQNLDKIAEILRRMSKNKY